MIKLVDIQFSLSPVTSALLVPDAHLSTLLINTLTTQYEYGYVPRIWPLHELSYESLIMPQISVFSIPCTILSIH